MTRYEPFRLNSIAHLLILKSFCDKSWCLYVTSRSLMSFRLPDNVFHLSLSLTILSQVSTNSINSFFTIFSSQPDNMLLYTALKDNYRNGQQISKATIIPITAAFASDIPAGHNFPNRCHHRTSANELSIGPLNCQPLLCVRQWAQVKPPKSAYRRSGYHRKLNHSIRAGFAPTHTGLN